MEGGGERGGQAEEGAGAQGAAHAKVQGSGQEGGGEQEGRHRRLLPQPRHQEDRREGGGRKVIVLCTLMLKYVVIFVLRLERVLKINIG